MRPDVLIAPTPENLASASAEVFAAFAKEAVAERGQFSVALSGGSTPVATYRCLAVRVDMPWTRMRVFWSDERCVPTDHPDSNYGAAWRAMLAHVAVLRGRIHRMRGEAEPEGEARRYEALLRRHVPGQPPRLDLILLGLGADGHTASLFPSNPALNERERLVVSVEPEGGVAHRRLTFALPTINAARRVLFLAAGSAKADIVEQILCGRGSELPASRVQLQGGDMMWMLDEAAASRLGDALKRVGRQAWAGRSRPPA